jgi:sodium-dependent dicarboxylate transporter 2/3/5
LTPEPGDTSELATPVGRVRALGLVAGVAGFLALQWMPAPAGLSAAGWDTAAVAFWVAVWWVTEAIPLSATALLPVVLLPLLGAVSVRDAAIPYANPVILLLLGGFILALGMQRWGLHKRIALNLLARVGGSPRRLVGGFMLTAALISMWVFNTTTTVMMLPIAFSVIEFVERQTGPDPDRAAAGRTFATVLMIGVAYGATIGGMGTLIGTAPNAVLAGFMAETYGVEVSFFRWMMVGLPMVAVMLPLTWVLLVYVAYPIRLGPLPGQNEIITGELRALGPMTRGERRVATVVAATAAVWVLRPALDDLLPWVHLNDTSIGLFGALALFLTPVDLKRGVFALSGEWARELPWGVIILFGGGLSLAAAVKSSGLSDWIGAGSGGLAALSPFAVLLGIVVVIILLTEITSNTATTATFLPIVASVAVGIGENPLLFVFPTVLAASCAFMMPVATPPNAVVFASGFIRIHQLMRAGALANLLGVFVTTVMAYTAVRWVFGIELGVLPDWAAAVAAPPQ